MQQVFSKFISYLVICSRVIIKIDIHLENGHGKEHSDKQEVTSVCEFILASGHVSHPCGIVSIGGMTATLSF